MRPAFGPVSACLLVTRLSLQSATWNSSPGPVSLWRALSGSQALPSISASSFSRIACGKNSTLLCSLSGAATPHSSGASTWGDRGPQWMDDCDVGPCGRAGTGRLQFSVIIGGSHKLFLEEAGAGRIGIWVGKEILLDPSGRLRKSRVDVTQHFTFWVDISQKETRI